jgi:hypothetical protein
MEEKMTRKASENDVKLEQVNYLFASLEANQSTTMALREAQKERFFNTIAFSDIMKAILEPKTHPETWKLIANNIQARRQLNIAMKFLSAAHNPVQAAAANGLLMSRNGDDFSMTLTFSSRGDGAAYLELILSDLCEMNIDNPNQYLYCLVSRGLFMKKLADFASRKTVLLLDSDDDMISAFQDHKAEFYIR